ncbi:hypothetical protein P3592_12695 [Vibrio parahaemolyticus]|uniref:hypothetical protein n=1 Tax=Vibrio parahaemolyticus TaxID=670 RepID=UPI00084B8E01|nr:hypothetical protein [Vibrio parahaemolyticus]EHK0059264.1 hypothetical protein [Vibrio parahaemolyticus]EHR6176274.1 hypothetical protein [Vibrio parahaemolyticus]MCG0019609.1 hypothetical protein [Vibrio parahaemolyticus]MDF4801692.1 hypothetical protein [Vibrio parahaemolyticus]MDF4852638.1 hypothetical protein [Vibrio parahaemolyticus]
MHINHALYRSEKYSDESIEEILSRLNNTDYFYLNESNPSEGAYLTKKKKNILIVKRKTSRSSEAHQDRLFNDREFINSSSIVAGREIGGELRCKLEQDKNKTKITYSWYPDEFVQKFCYAFIFLAFLMSALKFTPGDYDVIWNLLKAVLIFSVPSLLQMIHLPGQIKLANKILRLNNTKQ